MAYFRLPRDAEDWFKHIFRNGLPLEFDIYYLCLMCGIKEQRLDDGTGIPAKDVISYFPNEYFEKRHLLIGILLQTELVRNAVDPRNRPAVESLVKRLVDPHSSTGLTEEGIRLMNKYAVGGFQYLQEHLDPPQLVEAFLQFYVEQFG